MSVSLNDQPSHPSIAMPFQKDQDQNLLCFAIIAEDSNLCIKAIPCGKVVQQTLGKV